MIRGEITLMIWMGGLPWQTFFRKEDHTTISCNETKTWSKQSLKESRELLTHFLVKSLKELNKINLIRIRILSETLQ